MADYIVHKAVELSNLSAKARTAITEVEWLVSPKYDGCHAVFIFDKGQHVATYSRSGEVVRSMDHIARSLLDLYPIGDGQVAVAGEAWMLGKPFNEISGAFRRHSPQPQLQFVPFDIVPFDYNDQGFASAPVLLGQHQGKHTPISYKKRLGSLINMRVDMPSAVLRPRYTSYLGTLAEAYAWATTYARELKDHRDNHFDGAVLAQASGQYWVGSGSGGEFIKVKPLLSETVKVTAVVSDIGGKTGKNTCVLCFDLGGHIQKVSTGLTQAQADEYTAHPENIIDQYIEVEAMGLTANGLLREPRYKGIRTDV